MQSFKGVVEFIATFCPCVCFQVGNFERMVDKRGLHAWKCWEPPGWVLAQGLSGPAASDPSRGTVVPQGPQHELGYQTSRGLSPYSASH